MTHEAPQIVQLAERVLLEIEAAVCGFPRYHKYAIGAELRNEARAVARAAHRAWRDRDDKAERIRELAVAIDNLKLSLQIAQRLQAFKSFAQFEAISRIVSDLGRQCGGWQKKHLTSQNCQASAPGGRAQILSARDTSQGVNL